MKFIAKIELLLIAIWLGAAMFFSFALAPSAFAVLQNPELAGNLVNRTLMIINISGLIIGALTVATSFLPHNYSSAFWAWSRRLLLLVVALACAVGQFVIGFWLAFLRLQIGKPVSELALDDPLKLKFDQLHQASVWVLAIAMVAALLAFFIMSKRSDAIPKKEKPLIDPEIDFSKEINI